MEYFHLSPHENILTIALIIIHYLYTISDSLEGSLKTSTDAGSINTHLVRHNDARLTSQQGKFRIAFVQSKCSNHAKSKVCYNFVVTACQIK